MQGYEPEGKTLMTHRDNRGYSLIELAILFVILVIVSIFVFVSRDLFFGASSRSHTEDLGVAVIRMGIANYANQSREEDRTPVYPLRLDDAPAGTEASDETPLFTRVLPEGIRSGWRKEAANEYVYRPEGNRRDREGSYYYHPSTGTFDRETPESRQVRFVQLSDGLAPWGAPQTPVVRREDLPQQMSWSVYYE